ncbi:hypothetical protein L2D08_03290 [Domibacillus sp. PGB-M46]|uniref:hypothetical protein n=1 Tax=Domibacillus sp. PGB-M46 TaxID=2910255 RepID=UPI001F5739B1|nr:hypothetical protein [Domibacillus sp. PGB-M46]MCI2253386.1 hypothetical protein [Domibacillus sp. PGB-M46]
MRHYAFLILLAVLLAGCRSGDPEEGQADAIDWVDFVKWNGVEYHGIHTGILADKNAVGEKVGQVTFTVAGHITEPSYKPKDGDAAFYGKGTGLYTVKEHPGLLAVKDKQAKNGYKLYYSTKAGGYRWHFDNVPIEKVIRAEVFPDGQKQGRSISGSDLKHLLKLLTTSEPVDSFIPNTKEEGVSYHIVLYTGEAVAYQYSVQYDGITYYWHPWDTAILDDDIKPFLESWKE